MKIDRLVDCERIGRSNEQEGRALGAQKIEDFLRALLETAQHIVELDQKLRHVLEKSRADETRQSSQNKCAPPAEELQRKAPGGKGRTGEPLQGGRVDRVGELLGSVEEVEGVGRRRRIEHDEVPA